MFADAAVLVVRDMQVLERIAREQEAIYGPAASEVARVFAFDIPLEGEALVAAGDDVVAALRAAYSESYTERRYAGRESQYLMSGGLMFLGVFLGLLFVMAMVLMMYYKQISEGYDDRARYAIMRSVGLDDREIRRSINSQVLTVFFLPLIAACVHTGVAFFIVQRVMMVFGLTDVKLLMICTGASMLFFSVFYAVTYSVTAHVYYRIVSGTASP